MPWVGKPAANKQLLYLLKRAHLFNHLHPNTTGRGLYFVTHGWCSLPNLTDVIFGVFTEATQKEMFITYKATALASALEK